MRRAAFLALLASCRPSGPEVVVFVSLDRMYAEPILKDFEKQTGIRVLAVYDQEASKTTGLVAKLLQAQERPEADVFWNSEIVRTIWLKRRGVLQAYATDGPLRDPEGYWTGFAARARVILHTTNFSPRSLEDFTRPEWKGKFAIANPLFGTTATQIAALFARDPAGAESLLRALKANDARITAGNAMARDDVVEGRAAACFTDTDDALGALRAGKNVKMVYPDPTLLIPNTVALIKGGPNPANGRKLIDYLVSREVEARLAKGESAQIPLRPGVEPHSPDFDLSKLRAMSVDYEKLADALDRSSKFVREVFIR